MAVANTSPVAAVSATQNINISRKLFTQGANTGTLKADTAVLAADDDTSVFRLFQNVDPTTRLMELLIGCSAITGGTSFDIGAYEAGGAVIAGKVAVFAAALDLSSAILLSVRSAKNGMGAVAASDVGKTIGELLGFTSANSRPIDICATANTVGTAAGTISARMDYVVPST